MVTLREVLQLPMMGCAQVVAGLDRLDTPVRWVHITELPDAARSLLGGELVLTHGLSLTDRAVQRRFVEQIAHKGAAGLVVELGRVFTEPPEGMVGAAEACHFPLIVLTRPVKFVELTCAICARIINRYYTVLQDVERFSERLLHILMHRKGIPAILEALHSVVGRPLMVVNSVTGELAAVYPPGAAPVGGGSGASAARDTAPPSGSALSPVGEWAIRKEIRLGSYLWGELLIGQDEPLSDVAEIAVERAISAMGCEIMRLEDAESRRRTAAAMVLDNILAETGDYAECIRAAENLGIELWGRWLTLVVAQFASVPDDFYSVSARDRLIESVFTGSGLRPLIRSSKDEAVLLVAERSREALVARVCAAVRALERELPLRWPQGKVVVGAGTPTLRMEWLSRTLAEAQRSLKVQRYLGASDRSPFFDTMGVYQLLAAIPAHELANFVERELGALLRYDRENQTELTRTLRVLLDQNLSMTEAGRILQVHRQTLYNRVQRIQEILDTSLDDPDARFKLGLALRARDLLEG